MNSLKTEEVKARYKHEAEADDINLDNEDEIRQFPVFKSIKDIHHLKSLIMFEGENGLQPNILNLGYFVFLVTVMIFNLYNFAKF